MEATGHDYEQQGAGSMTEYDENVNDEIERIWREFPEAKPFADLVTASDVESFREVAREVAMRVRKVQGEKTRESQPPEQRAAEPGTPKAKSVAEAIADRSWPDYLAAKWEEVGRG